jgi:hypothetical protein
LLDIRINEVEIDYKNLTVVFNGRIDIFSGLAKINPLYKVNFKLLVTFYSTLGLLLVNARSRIDLGMLFLAINYELVVTKLLSLNKWIDIN